MVSPHTAFPADGYTARWRTWDHAHVETLTLRWENEAWTVTGEVGREAITYVIRLSPSWQVRQFLLFRDLDEPDLWFGTDGAGRWGEINGAHRPELDGCIDVDLRCTPFTHSIPIRRMQLEVGDAAAIRSVHVDVETLALVPVTQRCRRIGERRYELVDDDGAVEFDVDEYGLVHDLTDRFRRL